MVAHVQHLRAPRALVRRPAFSREKSRLLLTCGLATRATLLLTRDRVSLCPFFRGLRAAGAGGGWSGGEERRAGGLRLLPRLFVALRAEKVSPPLSFFPPSSVVLVPRADEISSRVICTAPVLLCARRRRCLGLVLFIIRGLPWLVGGRAALSSPFPGLASEEEESLGLPGRGRAAASGVGSCGEETGRAIYVSSSCARAGAAASRAEQTGRSPGGACRRVGRGRDGIVGGLLVASASTQCC